MKTKTMLQHFNEHLDRCQQCRENPFDLCDIGILLLLACASHEFGIGSISDGKISFFPDENVNQSNKKEG